MQAVVLTRKEIEVLVWLWQGYKLDRIANNFGMSVVEIDSIVKSLYKKYGCELFTLHELVGKSIHDLDRLLSA